MEIHSVLQFFDGKKEMGFSFTLWNTVTGANGKIIRMNLTPPSPLPSV